MQIIAFTMEYPPARFIGSEVMTHRLLLELREAGHDVLVLVRDADPEAAWEFEGIPVQHRTAPRPHADLVICHVDLANRAYAAARRFRAPLVGICHNDGPTVRHNLERIPFSGVIVNSESMRASLGAEGAIVVNPPMRDHRQPRSEQGRPLLAHRAPAA